MNQRFFPLHFFFNGLLSAKKTVRWRRSVIGFIKIARIDPIPHKECVQQANFTEIAIFMIISMVMRVACSKIKPLNHFSNVKLFIKRIAVDYGYGREIYMKY